MSHFVFERSKRAINAHLVVHKPIEYKYGCGKVDFVQFGSHVIGSIVGFDIRRQVLTLDQRNITLGL